MSDYPMLISNKLHSFRNFWVQIYRFFRDGAYTDYGSGYHYSGNVSGSGRR